MNQLNIKRNSKIFISLLFFILLVFIIPSKHKQDLPLIIDLQQIRSRGKLIATTENNAIDYFIYRGQPMGFQLELLQWFAKHIGVKLELILSNDKSQAISKLINHKCDIVAMDVINNSNAAIVFTIPYAYTRQVLVQRKPPGWQYMSKDSLEKLLVRQLYQLRGKTIFVPVESFEYYKNFSNFLTFGYEPVFFSKVAGMDSWELIALVASGEIDYTITNEFTANLNNMFFKDLDFKTVLTPPHPLTWAVRRESSILLDSLNSWIKYISKTHEYKILCLRYLKNQSYSRMLKNAYFPLKGGKISPYDKEFKKLSKEINWDWRLLASLVYQESRFDTGYIGLGGAMGLMQLMPITAQNYNVDSNSTTLENLKAGVRYIK
ncbi:MAG TPA: lytic transglycosylase F, partial [Bacteroidales bacterium]|nr:lytic transglycosylase F [Bacteroidales bacterium]